MNIDTEDGDNDESDLISNSSSSSDTEKFSITEDHGMTLLETSPASEDNNEKMFDSVSLSGSASDSNLEHHVELEHDSDLEEPYDMNSTSIYMVYCNAMIFMSM
eukprot:6610891-Ditylum_brightwellii.AAC.1